MSEPNHPETLNLEEAADFLKIHTVTLSIKAASGQIQGAKIGKRWVFLKIDLIMHIRSQYQLRAVQGEKKELLCHSTNAKILQHGGLKSQLVEEQYKAALGQATKSKPRNTTTS
jgi:hypothetical protein